MITQEKWSQLSLGQQMGHVASEIARARHWEEKKDSQNRNKALERAIELVNLTLQDNRWKDETKEVFPLRDSISNWLSGTQKANSSLTDLEETCINFLGK